MSSGPARRLTGSVTVVCDGPPFDQHHLDNSLQHLSDLVA
jgi:hypothetical protein